MNDKPICDICKEEFNPTDLYRPNAKRVCESCKMQFLDRWPDCKPLNFADNL